MQISEIELLKSNVASPDELLKEAKALHFEMLEGRKNFLTTTLIARELPESRKRVTKVLNRGEYSQPIGDPLSPGIFLFLAQYPRMLPTIEWVWLTGWSMVIIH